MNFFDVPKSVGEVFVWCQEVVWGRFGAQARVDGDSLAYVWGRPLPPGGEKLAPSRFLRISIGKAVS